MAVTFVLRIGYLIPEFLANTFVFLCPFQAARTISTCSFQSFTDGLHHLGILIQFYCHRLTSLPFYYNGGVKTHGALNANLTHSFFFSANTFFGGMYMTEKEYGALVKDMMPKSPIWKDCLKAFGIGGLICALGQLIMNGYLALGMAQTDAGTATSMTLVTISALLTGLSLYDDIAKHAGAGTLVPITGFANAIAAPAVEFKTEGFVLGVGAKMFTIAGPVIVYGISASVIYGLIYWITTLF